MNTVLRFNITEEAIEEMPAIGRNRAFHSCEVFEGKILITGGTRGEVTIADEVYDLSTNKSSTLHMSSSLGRSRHQLLRLEETIFAFGHSAILNSHCQ